MLSLCRAVSAPESCWTRSLRTPASPRGRSGCRSRSPAPPVSPSFPSFLRHRRGGGWTVDLLPAWARLWAASRPPARPTLGMHLTHRCCDVLLLWSRFCPVRTCWGRLVPPGEERLRHPTVTAIGLKTKALPVHRVPCSPSRALGPDLTVRMEASRRACGIVLQEGPFRGDVALITALCFPSPRTYRAQARHPCLVSPESSCFTEWASGGCPSCQATPFRDRPRLLASLGPRAEGRVL